MLLEPVLCEFLDAHPDIVFDNSLTYVVGQGLDAGIRFGNVLEKD